MNHLTGKQNRFNSFFSWGYYYGTGFICCGHRCVCERR